MSTAAFNPMKKAPPPPPPVDTSNVSPQNHVKLISKEGHEFIIDRECAKVARLIKSYLTSQPGGAVSRREVVLEENTVPEEMPIIRLPYTSAALLEKTVQYFYFKHRYESDPENRPTFHVPHEMAIELIKVATMLQC